MKLGICSLTLALGLSAILTVPAAAQTSAVANDSSILLDKSSPAALKPPAYVLPPVNQYCVPESLSCDPLLDRPSMRCRGWFADADLSLFSVHLRNQLTETIAVGGRTDVFDGATTSGSPLNVAVSPRFEVGYEIGEGFGEFALAYRFLVVSGSASPLTDVGVAAQNGHLDLNVVDLLYRSREAVLGEFPGNLWDFRWDVGVRLSEIDFSNNFTFANSTPPTATTVLSRRTFNQFTGVGPIAQLHLERKLDGLFPGLSFGGRFEASDNFGRINQQFAETLPGPTSGVINKQLEVAVLTLQSQIGFGYAPSNRASMFLGWQYETWFEVGRLDDSRAQLDLSGFIVRLEYAF